MGQGYRVGLLCNYPLSIFTTLFTKSIFQLKKPFHLKDETTRGTTLVKLGQQNLIDFFA